MAEQANTAKPVVIVDNAKVTYRVYASGKAVHEGESNSRVKRTGNLRTVEAIKGVSLIAHEGDVIGVIGSNGSGKTSLMKAISGLTPLDGGKIFATSRPSFLGVGAAMLKELSGEKNIILGGLAMGFSRAEIKEKLDQIIEFSGLKDFIELPMRTYSSGMTERLKFSIAASREHDILIIDEALAVGDSKFRKRSEARMKELAKNAGCVFLVSHSLKSILDTCNRAIWLDEGVLRAEGTAYEVCKAYADEVGADLDD
ncbi:MAG: ABC transporter ATP-binding protein [Aquiluna sp.]|jgi:teichoic acid transport system ATP-binding protein|nr:ABC transporter ATP-binding protein [Aquiluna sp.]